MPCHASLSRGSDSTIHADLTVHSSRRRHRERDYPDRDSAVT
jgi:hypothetical protein